MGGSLILFGPEMPPRLQAFPGHPIFRLDLVVPNPQDLGQVLDQAVQQMIPTALERRQGILVTHIFPNKYTVEVDQGVPCGLTREKRVDAETRVQYTVICCHASGTDANFEAMGRETP
ncbi:hypothetical protein [Pseudarthrobacter sp. YAF2]|uniref:hypothetical protein n=1 Tax=Pseudarthrobacter sp. YAF2 TaxID=3233078 RepID=UPI003F9BF632